MKNNILILLFAFILPFMASAQPPSSAYKLVFNEDFSVDASDLGAEEKPRSQSSYDNDINIYGTCSWPVKKNVEISNGSLNLSVIHEPTRSPADPNSPLKEYSAGRTHIESAFRYGYFEARIKITKVDHIWATFWLAKLTTKGRLGRYQEIDIMETNTHTAQKEARATVHVRSQSNTSPDDDATASHLLSSINLTDYHIYGCEWTPTEIKIFLDGQLEATFPNLDLHDPMYIIFDTKRQNQNFSNISCSSGNDWSTSVMTVDYVKVWQKPYSGSVYGNGQRFFNNSYSENPRPVSGQLSQHSRNLSNFISKAPAQSFWESPFNSLQVAWYPQADYQVIDKPANIEIREDWGPVPIGEGYNYRGELTHRYEYYCNTPGIYKFKVKITFPSIGSDFEEIVTFTIKVGIPETEFYVQHFVLQCFGLDFITNVSSDIPMDNNIAYDISRDDGNTWESIADNANNNQGDGDNYNILIRGHLNGKIYEQSGISHSQTIETFCGWGLVQSTLPKGSLQNQQPKSSDVTDDNQKSEVFSPLIQEVKSNVYKTLIYNISGQLIKTCETNQAQVKDFLTEFSSGMYFVHQFDKNGKKMATFKVSWVK
jgi:beta-glucanase (GH16 family)